MSRIPAAAIALLVAALAACQKDLDRRYLDASLGANLELPPDLDEFEAQSAFELPPGISGDDPNDRSRVPVLAKVDGLRLEGSGDFYWLEADAPVSDLYPRVRNFWAAEGYRLAVDEPVIGIMQTEWVFKEEGTKDESAGWLERLFSRDDFSATQDQFRTRIERNPAGGGSRIYIAHRGTEFEYEVPNSDLLPRDDADDNAWRFRQPEPELEVEMLSRLMIYLGLDQVEAERQLARVKLFSPRSFYQVDGEENSPYLLLRAPYQLAWNRVYHELERLNFPIVDSLFRGEIVARGYITFQSRVIVERERGGFFGLGSRKESVAKQYTLVLSEETHETTRVEIEGEGGELDTTPEGAELLTLLHQQLR